MKIQKKSREKSYRQIKGAHLQFTVKWEKSSLSSKFPIHAFCCHMELLISG